MPDLSGQSIDRYHIVEKVGTGGMAVVYKAFDTRLECDVAVKFIRMERLTQEMVETALKRFEREAKAVAQLTHPNIVKVTDYGAYQESPYLVMPFLPGGTLKQRIGQPVPYPEAARLLIPIAYALQYAHNHQLVHRDVKPSNILITETGEPMLTDFGIAKILDVQEGEALTGTGVGIGTPEYMAPEQWRSQITPAVDIFALGVVFFELVTGHKPYTADTPLAVVLKQTMDPLPRPSSFVSDIPEKVEQILYKALAKNPEDRYSSMNEMAKALEQLVQIASPVGDFASAQPKTPASTESTQELETVDDLQTQKFDPTLEETASPSPRRKATGWLVLSGLVIAGIIIGWVLLGQIGGADPTPTSPQIGATEGMNLVGGTAPSDVAVDSIIQPQPAVIENGIKICEVTDSSSIDDSSFNATIWKGLQNAQTDFGIQVEYRLSEQESDYAINIQSFIEEKCSLIITVGYMLADATRDAAQAHPDVQFATIDSNLDPDLPNVLELTYQADQAAFLAGYLAAAVSQTGKVATYGGMQYPSVTIFMDGFYYGVQYYNEQNHRSVSVLGWDPDSQTGLFSGDFVNTDNGYSMGATLIQEGADVIFPVAGSVGLGTAQAMKDAGSGWMIGVDNDWRVSAPEYADVILTSVIKQMDVSVYDTVQKFIEGVFTTGTYAGTLENQGVGITAITNAYVSADLRTTLNTISAGIIDGSIQTRP